MVNHLYSVIHSYFNFDCMEIKFIGVFSSLENANKAIDISWKLKGFNQYPRECFHIKEYELDTLPNKNGFDEKDLLTIEI